jgi:hypothetical protein
MTTRVPLDSCSELALVERILQPSHDEIVEGHHAAHELAMELAAKLE